MIELYKRIWATTWRDQLILIVFSLLIAALDAVPLPEVSAAHPVGDIAARLRDTSTPASKAELVGWLLTPIILTVQDRPNGHHDVTRTYCLVACAREER